MVTADGHSLSFGWNKHGQLGSGSVRNGGFELFGSFMFNSREIFFLVWLLNLFFLFVKNFILCLSFCRN